MRRIKIFLVDDDMDYVDSMSGLLRKAGFKVIPITDSKKALERAKIEHPDLILLDIMMPELDGVEVCRQLKSDETVKSIPIVMLSASWKQDDITAAKEAGADSYLVKVVRFRKLVDRIMDVLKLKTQK